MTYIFKAILTVFLFLHQCIDLFDVAPHLPLFRFSLSSTDIIIEVTKPESEYVLKQLYTSYSWLASKSFTLSNTF